MDENEELVVSASPAQVELYSGPKSAGPVANRLLANGFDINALRTNDVLRKDEWKHYDQAVIDIARQRLVGVADLQSRGLTYEIPNGMGSTVLEYEDMSDMTDAEVSMDGITRSKSDRVEFDLNALPLPIIHKDFYINGRVLNSSRVTGRPLDTTQAEVASRKVAEKVESILFLGNSAYSFGGGIIRGYLDFPFRNTVSLTGNWDESAQNGQDILNDVLSMKQASIDDSHYGPWMLYVPTNYDTTLDDEYTTGYPKSIRQRLIEIAGIDDIKVADFLTDDNVLLVQMSSNVVRMVNGMSFTTVEWESHGGFRLHFKVMTIMVPQLRADQNDKCGIIHAS